MPSELIADQCYGLIRLFPELVGRPLLVTELLRSDGLAASVA